MKISLIAISDIHGNLNSTSRIACIASELNVDAIIVSGDLSPYMSIETAKEILGILAESGKPVLYIPGNMDDPKLKEGVEVNGTQCIHGKVIEFKGIQIAGMGGGLIGPFRTPIEYSEDEFNEILKEMSKQINSENFILVTHNPPYNTRADKLAIGEHVGSISIRRFIEKRQPIINICGHIHEARGKDSIGRTIIVNVGPLKHGYYAKIESEDRIKVELLKLE